MISRIILIQNDRSILKYISFQNREALTRDCGKFLGQINFPHFEQRSKIIIFENYSLVERKPSSNYSYKKNQRTQQLSF